MTSEPIIPRWLPVIALLLLVLAAAAPWRFVVGSAIPTVSVLDLALLAACVAIAVMVAAGGEIELGPGAVLAVLVIAPLVAMLSAAWAENISIAVRASILATETVVAYLVGVNLAGRTGARWAARAMALFVLGCLVVSALFYLRVPGFGLYVPSGGRQDIGRLVSAFARFSHPFIGLSNDYAPILGMAALLCAGLARAGASRASVWGAFLASCGIVLTLSRGAIAAFLVAGFLYVMIVGARRRTVLLISVAASLLAVGGWFVLTQFEIRIGGDTLTGADILADRFQNSANISSRFEHFEATWAEAATRPWAGAGAGVLDPTGRGALSDASHNTVLEQLLFFGGLLGTLVAAAWLALPGVLWYALPPTRTRPISAALVAAAVFLVLTSLTQTFLEATVPRVVVHLLLGLGVGAALSRDNEERQC